MPIDWRRDLMLWHPRLFPVPADEPHLAFGYPHCEAGWRDVLVRLCRRIEVALRDGETFEFVRIKQKVGILRVDWDGEASGETAVGIGRAIDLAVARSACTCELCGREGRLYDDAGALQTRYPDSDLASRTCAGCAGGAARPTSTMRATIERPTR